MSDLIDVIRRVVQQELAQQRGSLLGVVTAVFPHEDKDDDNNYEADVRLKHEDLELRKVPIAVGHIGIAAPPRVDDLVLVQFVNGDLNQPLILGRFYHADDRPPLHHEDEILFEQRVAADGTLNQLRFTNDGTIFLQRDVTKPEDNSEAKASLKIDGSSGTIEIKPANDRKSWIHVDGGNGDIQIQSGEKIVITLTHDGNLQITADSKPIGVKCSKITIEGDMDVKGDVTVIKGANSTKISGHEITGA